MSKSTEIDMTNGPLAGKIILYTLPLIFTSILNLMFNAADMVVVGQFADGAALAAVGSAGPLITLIVNVFMGLSVGTSVCVSHRYGAKDFEGVRKTVHTAMLASVIGGCLFGLIGVVGSRTFLTWMDSPADVIDLSTLYVRIYFLGMPASMVYNFGAAILRAVGETKRPMIFISVAGVVNVLLNLLTVIVLDMGVAGVAIATVASQCVSAALIVLYLMKQEGCVRLVLRELRIHSRLLVAIMRVGIPAGLQSTMFSIANVVIQSAVNSFESVAMEGAAASGNLEGFMYVAMNAFYHAALAFTGQNVGARKYERLLKVLGTCLVLVVSVGVVMGALMLVFGETLLGIYIPDSPEAIEYGMQRLTVIACTYFLCGIMECIVGCLRGMGASLIPMAISFVGSCLSRIVWVFTVFAAFPTFDVLLYCFPISWFLTDIMLIVAYIIYRRRLMRHARQPEEASVPV